MKIRTITGLHTLPFEKSYKILGYTFNQARRMQDSLDETMWSANKACWRDVKFYRSKDVPWRVKCRKMVEQVDSACCFGSESWSWSGAILDRLQGCGDKGCKVFVQIQKKKRMKR